MTPYEKSEAFKRLEKIAELEKRILGNIEDAKDGDDGEYIPESIRKDLKLRGSCPIPKEVLDGTIDEGFDSTISHLSKHRAMMLPGEALYHAIGKKDKGIYNSAINMSLSDILKMIINRAAVSQTQPEMPMHLDRFDEPKHVRIIVRMRGLSPDMLEKSAKSKVDTMDFFDSLQITYMTGRKENLGADYVKEHRKILEKLVNDGVIIKIIKILSSGMKTTIYDKTASSDTEDILYSLMLSGALQ